MVKRVGTYRESVECYSPDRAGLFPSIKDSFSDAPIENADKIKQFILTGGFLDIGTTAESVDVLTGESTGLRGNIRSDGYYSWPISLAYYIDRYNLRLPDDFVQHALES